MRRIILLLIAALFVVGAPSTAMAWSNGPTPDGFGTHDWILYEALRLAKPSWVDTEAALLVTDDPDSLYGQADRPNHSYLASGTYRGAPDVVATLYEQAVDAHRRGDFLAASRHLGVLAHYYGDMAVPFHTRLGAQDLALHKVYETEVGRMTYEPGMNADWISPWGRSPIVDVRATTVNMALTSRAMYPAVELHYRTGGFNIITELATRSLLNRAVNDMADIVRSIPLGMGIPDPVTVKTTVTHRYPAAEQSVVATVRCVDSAGLPVEAAKIEVRWSYADGDDVVYTYSDPNGVAKATADSSRLTVGRRVNVSARQVRTTPAVTASTVIASSASSSWFVPTHEIGFVGTTLSSRYPAQNTTVRAETVVLSRDGKPMAGLPVTFQWRYRTKTITKSTTTDANGIARQSRGIGTAALGRRVHVDATVTGGGTKKTATSSFVPSFDVQTMESWVSKNSPLQQTKVRAYTRCLDSDGNPVAGAKVTFTWRFRSSTFTSVAVTNSNGVARATRLIRKPTAGYPVNVTCTTPSRGSTKTSMTWFVPRKPVPSVPTTTPETSTAPVPQP